jgi:hypothetical protein
MFINCDLTTALEDGGVGGLIVAVAWIIKHFFFKPKPPAVYGGPPSPGSSAQGR